MKQMIPPILYRLRFFGILLVIAGLLSINPVKAFDGFTSALDIGAFEFTSNSSVSTVAAVTEENIAFNDQANFADILFVSPISPPPTPTEPPLHSSLLIMDGPTSVTAGETFSLSVQARGITGNGLYGAQLDINYDPTLISVSNLQVNPDLSFIVRNNVDTTASKIKLAASRQGKVPGLTGNVVLLTFDATANTPGTAIFTFENEKFGDAQAAAIEVNAQSFTVLITGTPTPEPTDGPTPEPTDEPTPQPTDQPTPEPTDEPTPEPTDEPTPEPTDEPTPEPTDEPTPEPTDQPTPQPTDEPTPQPTDQPTFTIVRGQVILAGRAGSNWADATVTIDDSSQNTTTDTGGKFTITNVTTGVHTSISADAPGYLPAVCTAPTLASPEANLTTIALLSGDINDDAKVDAIDATTIGVSFGNTGPGLPADINRDNVVDIFDIILLSVNFGQGQQIWKCQES